MRRRTLNVDGSPCKFQIIRMKTLNLTGLFVASFVGSGVAHGETATLEGSWSWSDSIWAMCPFVIAVPFIFWYLNNIRQRQAWKRYEQHIARNEQHMDRVEQCLDRIVKALEKTD